MWRLFKGGATRRIAWHGNNVDGPLWLLEFTAGDGAVTVYCGEQLLAGEAGNRVLRNPMHYPLDQLLLIYQLTTRGQGIVHAAGLVAHGQCVIAAGRSGAGKSTLSRCWAERHGMGAVLSDDRVIMGRAPGAGGTLEAYGSPWPGTLGAALNERRPARALVFLVKAPENRLVPLASREAVERLFPVASIPWFDAEYLTLALRNAERWLAGLPVYEFRFTPDADAVNALEGLSAMG
jgi:hypothetical protein